jgi:hypothetical protein
LNTSNNTKGNVEVFLTQKQKKQFWAIFGDNLGPVPTKATFNESFGRSVDKKKKKIKQRKRGQLLLNLFFFPQHQNHLPLDSGLEKNFD